MSTALQFALGIESSLAGAMAALYLGLVQGRALRWHARLFHLPDPGLSAYQRRPVSSLARVLAAAYWAILAWVLTWCWVAAPVAGVIATAAAEAALFFQLLERAHYADSLRRAEVAEALRDNGRSNAPDKES